MRDVGRSSTIAIQAGVVNHPHLRHSRDVVVSVLGKGRVRNRSGVNRSVECKGTMDDVSKRYRRESKPR